MTPTFWKYLVNKLQRTGHLHRSSSFARTQRNSVRRKLACYMNSRGWVKAISPSINLAQGFSGNTSAGWRNEVYSCEQHVGDTSSTTRCFAYSCNNVTKNTNAKHKEQPRNVPGRRPGTARTTGRRPFL